MVYFTMQPPPHNTRRDFLQGRAAADALFRLADGEGNFPGEAHSGAAGTLSTGNAPASPTGEFLLHLGRAAMACQFELYFNGREYPHATEAGMAALDLIEQLEDQLSVYRNHSEMSRLNQTATLAPMPVELGLFDLLAFSVRLHQETSGAFDISASPLSKAWGFFRRSGQMHAIFCPTLPWQRGP
jgi:thiamine biosynthesis lipoprotein